AGSSHIMCFGVPLRNRVSLVPLNDADGRFLCLNGPFPQGPTYWRKVERLAQSHKVFIYWQGSQHMEEHLFASTPPFDFMLSGEPDLPIAADAVIVPEQMIREKFARSFEKLAAVLTRLGDRGNQGVYVCGTPPPKGDTAAIRAALARERYWMQRLALLGSDPLAVPLTAPETLYKMWSVMQSMLRDVAHRHGAEFLPIPTEAQTPEGFLREEFWCRDVTHANENLGPLILRSLRPCL
ncbi:MAG TPA: hypothetical protein VF511_08200, partial [Chthoniobacterales bacterium]